MMGHYRPEPDGWAPCTSADLCALYAVYYRRCADPVLGKSKDNDILDSIAAELERRHPDFYNR